MSVHWKYRVIFSSTQIYYKIRRPASKLKTSILLIMLLNSFSDNKRQPVIESLYWAEPDLDRNNGGQ